MAAAVQFYRAAPFPRLRMPLPLVATEVCAGFPSPADDYLEGEFDLNELLVTDPPAKACGIKMGVPAHLSRDLFTQHRVEVFSSNYALYSDMSRRVMRVLADHAYREISSIWFGVTPPSQPQVICRPISAFIPG